MWARLRVVFPPTLQSRMSRAENAESASTLEQQAERDQLIAAKALSVSPRCGWRAVQNIHWSDENTSTSVQAHAVEESRRWSWGRMSSSRSYKNQLEVQKCFKVVRFKPSRVSFSHACFPLYFGRITGLTSKNLDKLPMFWHLHVLEKLWCASSLISWPEKAFSKGECVSICEYKRAWSWALRDTAGSASERRWGNCRNFGSNFKDKTNLGNDNSD